jgi:subtilisin family serine protease
MDALNLVHLTSLMERVHGRAEIMVGLIDGPVALNHPDLAGADIREVPGTLRGACARTDSLACAHGTFVAGMLSARRGSIAPAICPGCTLLVRSIFAETAVRDAAMPSATPEELAAALHESMEAGARVLNLSAALAHPSSYGECALEEALNRAVTRGVIVVAAAGNQGLVGSTPLTRHPWVIPVAACDLRGRPLSHTNLGASIGSHGLSAPGEAITSLGADGSPQTADGTSVAAPFVTGAVALLWSAFPDRPAAQIHLALTQASPPRRMAVVPPLLDAWGAYQILSAQASR